MNKSTQKTGILLTFLALSGSSFAASAVDADSLLDSFDTNKDGTLSGQEFRSAYQHLEPAGGERLAPVEEVFRSWDADGDDKLTAAEIEQGHRLSTRQPNRGGQPQADARLASGGQRHSDAQPANPDPDEILGMEVFDRNGEQIGEVGKLVVQKHSGKVFVVVDSGGFMGIGEEESAIPLTWFSARDGKLIAMKGLGEVAYDESQFVEYDPEDTSYDQASTARDPQVEQPEKDPATRAHERSGSLEQLAVHDPEELKGLTLYDEKGREIGEVNAVALKKEDRQFYLVISSDEVFGMGDQDLVVAVDELTDNGDGGLQLTQLESADPYVQADFLIVEEAD